MKKKKKPFKTLVGILFVIFLGLYIASVSGYYEAIVGGKVALTKAEQERFEKDVMEGKVVDIENYVLDDNKNYSNKFTKMGEGVSKGFITFITKGFKGLLDAIKNLFF